MKGSCFDVHISHLKVCTQTGVKTHKREAERWRCQGVAKHFESVVN